MEKIKNQSNWLKTENSFTCVPGSTRILPSLPKGIYNLIQDPRTKDFHLERLYDSFELPFKVYNLEDKFISHVLKTFESTEQNLGILLHGVKGTGKTVTAKILAMKMDLPVIIVSSPFEGGLADYLGSLDSECILFFDEFEKNFSGAENNSLLLSVMDGVYNTKTRKIFILTTNTININQNFLSRPSRIRYKKAFGNLPLDVVKSYLKENLSDQGKSDEVIAWVNTLSHSTIDVLKCIVDELNLHKCPVSDLKGIMNLQQARHLYSAICSDGCSTKEEFQKLLERAEAAVSSGETDSDGDQYKSLDDFEDLYYTSFATNVGIQQILVGEIVDCNEVAEACDSNGIFSVHCYGRLRYYRVLNLETKPNLYGLVY